MRPLVNHLIPCVTIWLLAVVWLHPRPLEIDWVNALLLLGALVVVPLGLDLARRSTPAGPALGLLQIAAFLQLPCAVLLALSYGQEIGGWAAVRAVPWLITTAVIALAGLARLWQRRSLAWEELCFDAGLVYLAVGGGWTFLARAGIRPMGFAPVIVLLTAVHFHFAGFALPLLTSLAGRALGGIWSRAAALGVIAGVPLVAVGITASQQGLGPVVEGVAAVVTAGAGLLAAALHLRLAAQRSRPTPVRALWLLTGLSLAGGMTLAALYGLRSWVSVSWLDIPWMWALHGTANSLGVGVAGLLSWVLASHLSAGNAPLPAAE